MGGCSKPLDFIDEQVNVTLEYEKESKSPADIKKSPTVIDFGTLGHVYAKEEKHEADANQSSSAVRQVATSLDSDEDDLAYLFDNPPSAKKDEEKRSFAL